jgi:dTDP-4-dehydrorhamnose 3,5-epimerase
MEYKFSDVIKDVAIITPFKHYDYRGEYIETFNQQFYEVFKYNAGAPIRWVQDDVSTSVRHTLRGLHGDKHTWKLVQCLYGSMLATVVDMRPESPSYLKWIQIPINDKNRTQVLIPAGCANGHLVMSEFGIFSYKQSEYYKGSENQFTIRWDDPSLDITWPIDKPILSERDKSAKLLELKDTVAAFLPNVDDIIKQHV